MTLVKVPVAHMYTHIHTKLHSCIALRMMLWLLHTVCNHQFASTVYAHYTSLSSVTLSDISKKASVVCVG